MIEHLAFQIAPTFCEQESLHSKRVTVTFSTEYRAIVSKRKSVMADNAAIPAHDLSKPTGAWSNRNCSRKRLRLLNFDFLFATELYQQLRIKSVLRRLGLRLAYNTEISHGIGLISPGCGERNVPVAIETYTVRVCCTQQSLTYSRGTS